MNIDEVVQGKIDADAAFQAEISFLSDEEKEIALQDKRAELVKAEFEALAKEKERAETIAKDQKTRAEKAEAKAKETKAEVKEKDSLSLSDIRALQDVHDDDVDSVQQWAKFKGISVAEAKKSPEMVSLIRNREDERKAAIAAAKGGSGGRTTVSNTDAQILQKASEGDLPEDDAGIERLAKARLAQKEAELAKRNS